MNKSLKKNLFLAACVLPALILFAVFIIYPTVKVFISSLYQDSGLGNVSQFVGLDNFKAMFQDDVFYIALKNTGFLMIVSGAPTILLALFFAAMLTSGKVKESNFYRVVFFFPSILSFVVIAILWSFIYHPTMGIINPVLHLFGMADLDIPVLGNRNTVMWAIAVTIIWQAAGYYMVMYIAGIDGISKEIYEAADIDGATGIQSFWTITIPLLWDILKTTIIFAINGVITNSFTIVRVMTDGGPDRDSEVLLTYMYKHAMNASFGYAMAIAVFVFAISIVLSIISNKVTGGETA
ncbi:carbohydrate ABC transporter permease [Ruminiclostridium cellobioparum]|uniref:carbohydrate ABC transporter permease n=1 Tax=Ruminiclostridium cellobioparum TaxID=29355 RepID=UPI0004834A6B|nr:sugar ABC transporter permease [Ruminiclostridium cellobioparum]